MGIIEAVGFPLFCAAILLGSWWTARLIAREQARDRAYDPPIDGGQGGPSF